VVADKDHEEVLMVGVLPAAEGSVPPDSLMEVEGSACLPLSSRSRLMRLIELREAIERGEYHVSAAALADALRYAARAAN
jgi:hypothetical protein